MSNLRWKVLTILAVTVLFGAVGVYPLVAARYGVAKPAVLMERALKLGLDLKGGVHLVVRVQTDDALKFECQTESERLREALTTAGISFTKIAVAESGTAFVVEGVQSGQDGAFRSAADGAVTTGNYDRSSGVGGTYAFTMKPNVAMNLRAESVTQARQTIERRVNALGVAEPSIAQQGANGDQILVQLPGMDDVERAKNIIRSEGQLELKIVENGPYPTEAEVGAVPEGMEIVKGAGNVPGADQFYLVRRAAAVTGRDLRTARAAMDENGRPAVSFTLNSEGATKFGKVTGDNIGRRLAIILDGRINSAPEIQGRITGEGRISGSFTQQEVADLSTVLRSGSLPATLTYLEERTIGPSLGADSIRSGVIASLVGLVLIVLFMLLYYKASGINAVVALVLNLIMLLGLMAYFGAVMTLPGIAGFVLTMGIGVDSNVLIFERIKEELEAGRGVRASINAGFGRVFLTLLDTHIAALISAAFLFQFGTGPIRGFAVTLFAGLMSNLFTATFVSKTLFEVVLSRRQQTTSLSI